MMHSQDQKSAKRFKSDTEEPSSFLPHIGHQAAFKICKISNKKQKNSGNSLPENRFNHQTCLGSVE